MDKIQPINHLISQTEIKELTHSTGLLNNLTTQVICLIILVLPFIYLLFAFLNHILDKNFKMTKQNWLELLIITILSWSGGGYLNHQIYTHRNQGVATNQITKTKQHLIYDISTNHTPSAIVKDSQDRTNIVTLNHQTQINVIDQNKPETLITLTDFNVPKVTQKDAHKDAYNKIYDQKKNNQTYKKYQATKQKIVINIHADSYQQLKKAQNKLTE